MTKKIGLKAAVFISMLSLANQSFTLVDSTTDNQLPSMRGTWRGSEFSECKENLGEMDLDLDSNAETSGNVVNQENPDHRNKQSDIEEMQSGGDYVSGWVSVETSGNVVNGSVNPVIDGYEDTIKNTDIDTMQTGGDPTNW